MVGYGRFQMAGSLALMSGFQALAQQVPLGLNQDEKPMVIAGRPLVDTEALQDSIKTDNLLARAKELYEIAKLGEDEYNHPTRVIGSEGHLGTLSYIYSSLAELGDYYTLSNQTFPAVTGRVAEFRLVLGDQVPGSASAMGLTPPTKDKEPVHADIVIVKNSGCKSSDFPAEVAGNIAFVERGTCAFGVKSENAGKAGAVATVIFNNDEGPLHGTLGTPSPYHVATFGLSDSDAAPVLKKLAKGERVDAIAYIDADVTTTYTDNIIAQTVQGDPDNCVMLGGHSDSVTEGPGINDDGSGSLSVLEVAKQLTKFNVNNCVRFSWWAAEEEGLLGSDHYAATLSPEENLKIRLFMDYDMMASPNFAYQIYNATNADSPTGSQELRDLYVDWYKSKGLNYTFIPFDGRSDYDGFIRAGIPAGGIATGAEGVKTKEEEQKFGGKAGDWFDPCYHQLCDDVSNLNLTAWEVNTKLIAHSVATYAASFDGFPKRTPVKSAATGGYGEKTRYHGSKLFI
ncbi:aminopeptidase Y precursor [Truncatella angustata]|uniref:Peptide hydrolase n=1 Tax=Truncatella angustata TaxID=152316 RepID=A0A9P8UAC7_9PEZI|nr:aminopeptidase Y precursor [Truncatella angustata]KAH6647179.1 aminopeptidase Y precursor [Truncatella angustata]